MTTHIWVRAEQRANEERVGLTPAGAAALTQAGLSVTIEQSATRAIPLSDYHGITTAPEGSWPDAPKDAIIFGLKELPDDGTPLCHRHIMFGHAYKGQAEGRALLDRFKAGGGTLYDLEYLVDAAGRRVAAFGYWAGYAGAAVSLLAWAQPELADLTTFGSASAMADTVKAALPRPPQVIVIGALGRVGSGAADLCAAVGAPVTKWDVAETAHGGPFPEILAHDVFLNAILARPGCPVFVPQSATTAERALTVIGDISCDPTSDFSPIKVYDRATDWASPTIRAHSDPRLDVMAIDNLPSLLPRESSEDFAEQLLPHLLCLDKIDAGVWARAKAEFDKHI